MKFIRDIIGEKREKSLLQVDPVPAGQAVAGDQLHEPENPLLGGLDDPEPVNIASTDEGRVAPRDTMVLTDAQRILAQKAMDVENAAFVEGPSEDNSATDEVSATMMLEEEFGDLAEPAILDLTSDEAEPNTEDVIEDELDTEDSHLLNQSDEMTIDTRSLISPRPDLSSPEEEKDELDAFTGEGMGEASSFGHALLPDDELDVTSVDEDLAIPSPDPMPAGIVDVPAPAMGRGASKGGRVKTRLLGFGAAGAAATDPIAAAQASDPAITQFPVGWLVVIEGPGRGAAFTLFNGVTSIGRGEDQTVSLNYGDNSISRENHAAIAFDPEQSRFFVGHGGKANLVRLNDRPVLATEELESGGTIRIGETTLRFVSLCGAEFSWEAV